MASFREVFLSCIVLSLLLCLKLSDGESCLSDCYKKMDEFTECSQVINDSSPNQSSLTLKFTSSSISPTALPAVHQSSTLISLLLTLLCTATDERQYWSNGVSPPYCVLYLVQEECTSYNQSCRDNCTQLNLSIWDQWTNTSVHPSHITNILSLDSSKTALALYGLVYINEETTVHPPPQSGGSGINSIPLASWICLALGVLISTITLLKPIWWDRGLAKLKRCIKK